MRLPKFLRLIGAHKRRDIDLFPPYWLMNIKILEADPHWRSIRILLPLSFFNRNMGGTMFGGCQSSLVDPIPAIACAKIFPGYAVWTRSLNIDFRLPGNSDLELRFNFDPELESRIRTELEQKNRSTPTFEFGLYRSDGQLCTWVVNTVAIRPRDGARARSAYR